MKGRLETGLELLRAVLSSTEVTAVIFSPVARDLFVVWMVDKKDKAE